MVSFDVGMSGAQEVPPVSGPGKGLAHFTFDDVTRQLTFSLTVTGLSPNLVTAAHIHRGAPGVNGPVIHNLSTTGFTQVAGTIQLSEAEAADLRAGNLYVNAHSVDNPGGFARGQLYLNTADGLRATGIAIVAAFNAHTPSFFDFFTDNALENSFGGTRAELLALGDDFFEGTPPLTLNSVTIVSSRDGVVLTDTELRFGLVIDRLRHEWVQEGGFWKINSETDVDEPVPSGTRVVEVRAQEFAFIYDRTAFASGNVAIDFSNVGKQLHEMVLVKIDRPESLLTILQSTSPDDEEPPPGIVDIALAFEEPGESGTVVFSQALAPGRYGMLCFVPDEATGTPHALLGMISEFTVGTSGGGTITPPSTGDAGLAGAGGYGSALVAGLLALSFGGFALPGLQWPPCLAGTEDEERGSARLPLSRCP
jgi:hypothetical protein